MENVEEQCRLNRLQIFRLVEENMENLQMEAREQHLRDIIEEAIDYCITDAVNQAADEGNCWLPILSWPWYSRSGRLDRWPLEFFGLYVPCTYVTHNSL